MPRVARTLGLDSPQMDEANLDNILGKTPKSLSNLKLYLYGVHKNEARNGIKMDLIGEQDAMQQYSSGDRPSISRYLSKNIFFTNQENIRIDFIYRGVRCRETLKVEPTKANLKYAERLRGEILNAISLGTFNYPDYFPDSKRAKLFGYSVVKATVGELLKEYMALAEKTLEPSTYNGYRKACEAHLYKAFGNIPVRDFSSITIRNYVTKLEVTLKTVRNILTPLRNMLDLALNDGLITSNPLDKLVLSKLVDKKTRTSDWQVDPFDLEEIKAILSEAKDQARNLFQFAFYTGLRTSELIALEWGDIDWLKGMVRVSRAVVLKKEKGTKTKSGQRDVLILPPALEALQNRKAYTFVEGQRIFFNPRTNTPWETDGQIRKTCWAHILKKAGVRYRNPYQTRHTYASMMLSAGENALWVAKQMGHRDTEMIIKNYGRWIPDKSTVAGYTTVNEWVSPLIGVVCK